MRRSSVMTILALFVGGYLGICGLLFIYQDSLLFFPTTESESALESMARLEGFGIWTGPSGGQLGWRKNSEVSGSPSDLDRTAADGEAMLILHGNGGMALHRTFYADLPKSAGAVSGGLFLFEYPGYGARPGSPSADAFIESATNAVDALLSENPNRKILLVGESIGTGVAAAVAARRPEAIAGLILIAPFDSLESAAAHHHPWLPVRLLLRHRFDSAENLKEFDGPVAVVLAGRDEVVPASLGQRLYDGLNEPKRIWVEADAGHNDAHLLLSRWDEILGWIHSHRGKTDLIP